MKKRKRKKKELYRKCKNKSKPWNNVLNIINSNNYSCSFVLGNYDNVLTRKFIKKHFFFAGTHNEIDETKSIATATNNYTIANNNNNVISNIKQNSKTFQLWNRLERLFLFYLRIHKHNFFTKINK